MIDFIIYTLAIAISAYLLPGIHITDITAVLITALILGIINTFIKPVLSILTLPLTIVTLGLFSLILNALLILLADSIVPGFTVDSFWWAVLFGIVLSVISGALLKIAKEDTKRIRTP